MGKQTFLIVSLLAVIGVAALGAWLMSGRSDGRAVRPGVERGALVESPGMER